MTKMEDLTGKQFGRLTVLERDMTSKRTKWICKCKCGKIKSIQATHLKSGATTSCGCYQAAHYVYYRLKYKNIKQSTENILRYANQLPINEETH